MKAVGAFMAFVVACFVPPSIHNADSPMGWRSGWEAATPWGETRGVVRAEMSDLAFTTLARGAFSGVQEARQVVIRDQAALTAWFAKIHATVAPAPPPPMVNFTDWMVVGVFLGTRWTGGYSVTIERIAVEPSSGNVVVYAVETQPPPDAIVTQAFTQPFHLVSVPARQGEVRFVLRVAERRR